MENATEYSPLFALYGEPQLIGFHGESVVVCVVGGRRKLVRDPSRSLANDSEMEISMKYTYQRGQLFDSGLVDRTLRKR